MDAERWRNIEDLFFGALDHEAIWRAQPSLTPTATATLNCEGK